MGSSGSTGSWFKAQLIPTFNHYDNGFKNIIDPTGSWGRGDKGEIFAFLGNTKAQDKKDKEAADKLAQQNSQGGPSVRDEAGDEDPNRLQRIGRAQLISSSSRGVLSNADTSSRTLFGVQ